MALVGTILGSTALIAVSLLPCFIIRSPFWESDTQTVERLRQQDHDSL